MPEEWEWRWGYASLYWVGAPHCTARRPKPRGRGRQRSRWNPHEEDPTPFISESATREDEQEPLRSLFPLLDKLGHMARTSSERQVQVTDKP